MKRERNILYFEPNEEEKFFRTIKLLAVIPRSKKNWWKTILHKKRHTLKKALEVIEHEKDHTNTFRELNCVDKITGYSIQIINRKYRFAVHKKKLTENEAFEIGLAPNKPSLEDFITAIGFGKIEKILERLPRKNNPGDLKKYVINEMVGNYSK